MIVSEGSVVLVLVLVLDEAVVKCCLNLDGNCPHIYIQIDAWKPPLLGPMM